MNIDINTILGIVVLFSTAIIGHGVLMWFRLGRIEGKIEMICQGLITNNKEILDVLKHLINK